MDIFHKIHASARPFVSDIQRGITKHWNNLEAFVDHVEPAEPVIITDESAIGQLPMEIKQHICSFMSSRDLMHMSQVSSFWNILCNDEALWKLKFDVEKYQWDSVQNCKNTGSSMWEKVVRVSSQEISDFWEYEVNRSPPQQTAPASPSWKATFITNYLANTPKKAKDDASLNGDATSSPDVEGKVLANIQNMRKAIKSNTPVIMNKLALKISPVMDQLKVPFKKIHRIPMLGEGLESTSKDLLYTMMWPENASNFRATCLYPGVEGFGSGVGFSVGDVNLNIAALHRCSLDDPRAAWKSYLSKADGIIYVVSSKDLLNTERRKLNRIVGGRDSLVPIQIPLLVLLVCEDPLNNRLRPSDLADQLNLEGLEGRTWCTQIVEMDTLKGLPEGLQWMASKL